MKRFALSTLAVLLCTLIMTPFITRGADLGLNITASDLSLGATNALSLTITPVTALQTGDTVSITSTQPLTASGGQVIVAGNSVTPTVTANTISLVLTAAQNAGTPMTITGVDMTNPAVAANVNVTVSTSRGDMDAVLVSVGDANVVNVSAIVEPTLSMSLVGQNIALGVIPTNAVVNSIADRAQSSTITVSTNAANGYVLSAQGSNAGTFGLSRMAQRYTALTPGQEGFAIRVANTNAAVLTGSGSIGAGTALDDAISTTQAGGLVASPTSASNHQTVVEYGVAVSPSTPSGTYTDRIIYTVVGRF